MRSEARKWPVEHDRASAICRHIADGYDGWGNIYPCSWSPRTRSSRLPSPCTTIVYGLSDIASASSPIPNQKLLGPAIVMVASPVHTFVGRVQAAPVAPLVNVHVLQSEDSFAIIGPAGKCTTS